MRTSIRVGKVRWGIATVLGIGIIINYFDRVNLSVATTSLIKEFHFTNTDIGLLLSAYLWSYTLLQIPVGAILDRIGVKWIMRVCFLILLGKIEQIQTPETGIITEMPEYVGASRNRVS